MLQMVEIRTNLQMAWYCFYFCNVLFGIQNAQISSTFLKCVPMHF